MNVKNLNPLERHIEKIVLAVALCGAGYIGYLAMQPITVPDHPEITAKDVEPQVTSAVADINALKEKVKNMGDLTPPIHDYLKDYQREIETVPVPQELVDAPIPQFGPKNVPVSREQTATNIVLTGAILTPTVPPPADVTTVPDLFVVNDPPQIVNGQVVPLPQGVPQPTHTVTLVDVSGTIPLAAFTSQMTDPNLKPTQRIPPEQQRTIVYRIEVQRRQLVASAWSSWQPVTASAIGGDLPNVDWDAVADPSALSQTETDIDAHFKQIVEPDFYTLANNAIFTPTILSIMKAKAAQTPPPPPPGAGGAAVAPRPGFPAAPAPQTDDEGGPSTPNSNLSPDVAAMKALPNVPFWFYDETTTGGQEYQYQVRLVMVNPNYHSAYGLADPSKTKEPLLYSPWTLVNNSVTVPSEQYFFVSNAVGGNKGARIGVEIYKWINGNWFNLSTNIDIGDQVAGRVQILNAIPPAPNFVQVDLGYTLVDVNTISTGLSGDAEAILLSPEGTLVRRSAKSDSMNSLHQHLIESLYHPPVAVPAAATQNGTGGTGTTPPTISPRSPRPAQGGGE